MAKSAPGRSGVEAPNRQRAQARRRRGAAIACLVLGGRQRPLDEREVFHASVERAVRVLVRVPPATRCGGPCDVALPLVIRAASGVPPS
eukprot:6041674-Pleurochrysis_carterae.AAC.1